MSKLIKYVFIILFLLQAHTVFGATVKKSIKSSGGDYTTIALWEADLDNVALYASGDNAVGELYNQSYLVTSTITINGGATVGLFTVTLSVAPGNRSTGTAGTGARITANASFSGQPIIDMIPFAGTNRYRLEYFEINGNGQQTSEFIAHLGTAGRVSIIKGVMLHDGTGTNATMRFINSSTRDLQVQNSILYDYIATGSNRSVTGMILNGDTTSGGVFNNIVYNLTANGTGAANGYVIQANDVDARIRNNICAALATNPTCFIFNATPTLVTSSNNISFDATADDAGLGSGNLINTTPLFVSTVSGSEDFTPQSPFAPQVNTGIDLGTTPSGVNIDFKGYDRDAGGPIWDIGAIELISSARVIRLHGVRLYGVRLQ